MTGGLVTRLRLGAGTMAAWARVVSGREGTIDRDAIVAHLAEDGHFSARFAVLTALSCSIAVLGLLLSSPAVIIGAMLISPLMGPIILFGFSLALLDQALMFRSFRAMAAGTLLAIGLSALIVWLSPLQSVTPEILARTRPNLFDLLVAIFSAIAGAYAVVQRKGETIVGVAIATALMPPLATCGFGLATANWPIFTGAGGLFMTNLLAIALTACLVAKFFGFGSHHPVHATLWQGLSIVVVFAVLSIPLGLSLKRIAVEAIQTSKVRAVLQDYFGQMSGHVYSVNVQFPADRPVQIEALALVPKSVASAEADLRRTLGKSLGQPVHLILSQAPMQPDEAVDQQAIAELMQRLESIPPPPPGQRVEEVAALQTGIPLTDISADPGAHRLVLRTGALPPARVPQMRAALDSLRERYSDWTVDLRVEPLELSPIAFAQNDAALDETAKARLADIIWLLHVSGVTSANVVGYSDTSGRSTRANRATASNRANAVAAVLDSAGIATTVTAFYPAPDQRRLERELGLSRFRRVEILPVR